MTWVKTYQTNSKYKITKQITAGFSIRLPPMLQNNKHQMRPLMPYASLTHTTDAYQAQRKNIKLN